MKNTTTTNYIVKVQTPDNSWVKMPQDFAFIEDAEEFASDITIGKTSIYLQKTTTVVEEEEIQ